MDPSFHDVLARVNSEISGQDLLAYVIPGNPRLTRFLKRGTPPVLLCLHHVGFPPELHWDAASNEVICNDAICPASRKSLLIEWVAEAIQRHPVALALEVADAFDVSLDSDRLAAMARFFAEEGDRLRAQRNFDAAAVNYGIALAASPSDIEFRVLSGRLHELSGAASQAVGEYRAAADLSAASGDHQRAILVLEEEVLRLEPFDESALELVARRRREAGGDDDSGWTTWMLRLADALMARGEHSASKKFLEEILESQPHHSEAQAAMVECLAGMGMEEESRRVQEHLLHDIRESVAVDPRSAVDRLVRTRPDDLALRMSIAQWRESSGDAEGCARDLEYVAAAGQEELSPDQRISVLERLVALQPGHLEAHQSLVRLYEEKQDHEKYADTLILMCRLMAEAELFDRAFEYIQQLEAIETEDETRQENIAFLLGQLGNEHAAAARFTEMGKERLQQGRLEQASKAFREAIARIPDNTALLREIDTLLDGSPLESLLPDLWLLHARAVFEAGAVEESIELLESLRERFGRNAALLQLRLEVLPHLDDADSLARLLAQTFDEAEDTELEDAVESLVREWIDKLPRNLELLGRLLSHYIVRGREKEAVPILVRMAASPSASVPDRVRSASHALRLAPGDPDVQLVHARARRDRGDRLLAIDSYRQAAAQLAAASRLHEAREAAREGLLLIPGDIHLLELMADLDNLEGRTTEAAAVYAHVCETLLENDTRSQDPTRLSVLFDKFEPDAELLRRAAERLKRTGDHSHVSRVYTRLAEQASIDADWEEALSYAQTATAENPANLAAWRLVADAQLFLGDPAESAESLSVAARHAMNAGDRTSARELLESAANLSQLSSDAIALLARIHIQASDWERVSELILSVLEEKSEGGKDDSLGTALEAILDELPENVFLFDKIAGQIHSSHPKASPNLETLLRRVYDAQALTSFLEIFRNTQPSGESLLAMTAAAMRVCASDGNSDDARDILRTAFSALLTRDDRRSLDALLGQAEEVLENDPALVALRGDIAQQDGRSRDAVALWQTAVEGYSLLDAKDEELELRQKIVATDPSRSREAIPISQILQSEGRTGEAAQILAETLRRLGSKADAEDVKGLHQSARELADAEPASMEPVISALLCIERNEEAVDLLDYAGNRLLAADRAEDAHELLSAFASECERYSSLAHLRATSAARTGDDEQAITIWSELVHRQQTAGVDTDEILRLVRLAVEVMPASTELRVHLIDLLAQTEDRDALISETAALIDLYVSRGEDDDAVALIASTAAGLIESRSFPHVRHLLDSYASLIQGDIRLRRYHALALEGLGEEEPASSIWEDIARWHESQGNSLEMELALRRAIALRPREIHLRRRLIEELRKQESTRIDELLLENRELATILESDSPEEAIRLYRDILQIDEENLEVLPRLARLLETHGSTEECIAVLLQHAKALQTFGSADQARNHYETVLTLDEENVDAWRGLAAVCDVEDLKERHIQALENLSRICEERGLTEEALESAAQWTELSPDDATAWNCLFRVSTATGDKEQAKRSFNRLLQIHLHDPQEVDFADVCRRLYARGDSFPELLEALGFALIEQEKHDEGLDQLIRASEIYLRESLPLDAVRLADRLMALKPEREDVYERMGLVYQEAGRTAKALDAWLALADRHSRMGNVYSELRVLELAWDLSPGSLAISRRIFRIYTSQGRVQDGVRAIRRCIAIAERETRQTDAIELLRECLQVLPDEPAIRESLADLLTRSGMKEEAAECRVWLADFFEAREEFARAITHATQALDLVDDAEIVLLLGNLYRKVGESEKAAACFLQVSEHASRTGNDVLLRASVLAGADLHPEDPEILNSALRCLIEEDDLHQARALGLRGMKALLGKGEVETALSLIRRIRELFPGSRELSLEIAAIYEEASLPELAAKEYIAVANAKKRESPNEALRYADKALELRPKDLEATRLKFDLGIDLGMESQVVALGDQLASIYLARGEREEASVILNLVVPIAPREPMPRSRLLQLLPADHPDRLAHLKTLVDLYLERDDLERASLSLEEILKIDPDDARMRRLYIDARIQLGRLNGLPEEFLELVRVYNESNESDKALETLERAGEIFPSHPEIQKKIIDAVLHREDPARAVGLACRLAAIFLGEQDAKRAQQTLEHIAVAGEDNPDFHALYARVFLALRLPGMALRSLHRSANLLLQQDRISEASATVEEMLKIDALDISSHEFLIEIQTHIGDRQGIVGARMRLAEVYTERGLPDLAAAQLRSALDEAPDEVLVWDKLVPLIERQDFQKECIPDYLKYANLLSRTGDARKAVEYYLKVVEIDPRNLAAHRGYIAQYPRIGQQSDIVDDILGFAQLLMEEGEVDEGVRYFNLVMSIDPENPVARDMLSATQARSSTSVRKLAYDTPEEAPQEPGQSSPPESDLDISDTQQRMLEHETKSRESQPVIPAQTGDTEQLKQVAQDYRDLLDVTPQHAAVRVKLADILGQMGDVAGMMKELDEASRIYFGKGELRPCIEVSERILKYDPSNQDVRKRLNEAILKRDAFKALESAILFTDQVDNSESESGTHHKKKDQ